MDLFTVRDAVFDFLRRQGVDTIFGNPGSTEIRMLRNFPEDFGYVLALQESIAVAAAAGHAIGTGLPGVVQLHSAGGVGHGLGALFNAFRDRVPLVVIAGQQTRVMLPTRPFLGADDPAMFPRPYVKWSAQPDRAEDVPGAVAEAYRMAMTHPRGPVFVSVPEDDWDRRAALVTDRAVAADFTGSPEALADVAAALNGARRPALVIGPGVDQEDAFPLAVELAERTTAAVWLTPLSARSGFPEDHRLFQGFLPPVREQIVRRLDGHDVVLSLGGPVFRYHVHTDGPFLPPGVAFYAMDSDPLQAAWAPAGTNVLSTVRNGLHVLLDLVEKRYRAAPPTRDLPPPAPPALTSAHVFDVLRAEVPPEAVVVEEIPSDREEFHARFRITRPGGFLTTGSGALGWGLPLAVGRALTAADRVVCIAGDGSSMYSIQALWTAVQQRAPVTFVIVNNGRYEAVKQLGLRLGADKIPGTDLGGIDFVQAAAALGCPGARVTAAGALRREVRTALAADGPYLLEIPVTGTKPAAYDESG